MVGFWTWIFTVVASWLLQRYVLKGLSEAQSKQLSETFFVLLFIPVVNIILSLVFLFAKEGQVTPDWIRRNVYQIKD